MTDEPLWTVSNVAAYLKIQPETVRAMARQGKIPAIKIGPRIWRFDQEQILAWVEAQRAGETND